LDEEGSIWLKPQALLEQQERHIYYRNINKVLVQWKYTTLEDAT
jgi:hypothetical protein